VRTWPLAVRFGPGDGLLDGRIYVGPDDGFHGGWLADATDVLYQRARPNAAGLAPVYKARLAEYSGAFGEREFGTRLILDLADAAPSELDLLTHGVRGVVPADEVFRANAARVREAVRLGKGVDQELQVHANELYVGLTAKLRAEVEAAPERGEETDTCC
jgi:hypothetical protein